MKRRDKLFALIRRVEAAGKREDEAIRTFAIRVLEARDESTAAALAKGVDAALDDLEAGLGGSAPAPSADVDRPA